MRRRGDSFSTPVIFAHGRTLTSEMLCDFGPAELRELVRRACDFDPGPFTRSDLLVGVGLTGVDLLACISLVESRLGIEFPADLLPALTTVDDLLYYAETKRSQR